MRSALAAAALAFVAVVASIAAAQDLTADQIVDRALGTDSIGFQSGAATMTLTIVDASAATRTRRLALRGIDEDGLGRTLVRVVEPAEQAGQAYLFRENRTGEDDVYVFMPALDDAPRRVAGASKNGAFMGTHFTYADLETRDIRDATYTRLADEQIGGFDVYVIDATPNADASSDYGRVRLWVRTTDFIPLRTVFYDRHDHEVKALFTEETDVDDGRTYVRQMTLRATAGGSTTMRLDSVDFDADISPGEFTPQSLAN